MSASNQSLQSQLKAIGNTLANSELASGAIEANLQKVAGEFSTLINAGELINGIKSITQNINHAGAATIVDGTGITKLTEAVSGLEQDLRTNIDADAGNLSTMTGETVSSAFRKKYYGGTSVESMNSMLVDATGKSTEQLTSTLQTFHTGDFVNKVGAALQTDLSSVLSIGQSNFTSLLSTFTSGTIGEVLQDITDKLDVGGTLFSKIGLLADLGLEANAIETAITNIVNKNFPDAINVIADNSSKSYDEVETTVRGYGTQLSQRLTGVSVENELPPFEIGTVPDGYNEPYDNSTGKSSPFTMVKSFDELEGDFRNASREITEIVLHWSESGINQFLTSEDLDEIQSGIRYHYVILRDGNIQRGLNINQRGSHVPTKAVANEKADLANNPNSLAVQSSTPVNYTPPPDLVGASDHNKYSIGVCIIGGIAAAAGSPEFERFLSKSSITPAQWDTIDGMFKTYYRVFPGGQAFGHNDIEPNQIDPGFSVPDYVFTKFKKQNIESNKALSVDELNQATITNYPGAR